MAIIPYRIVVLCSPEPRLMAEVEYLKSLISTYKDLYRQIDEEKNRESRIPSLKLVTLYPDSRNMFRNQLDKLREERDTKPVDGIHFIGHGWDTGRSTFIFAGQNRLNLRTKRVQEYFKSLGPGWMLFSCCDIGKNDTVMKEISTISERTVFAYSSSNIETADDDSRTALWGSQAFMVDSLFYHLMLNPHENFGRKYDNIPWSNINRRLQNAMRELAIRAQIKMFDI